MLCQELGATGGGNTPLSSRGLWSRATEKQLQIQCDSDHTWHVCKEQGPQKEAMFNSTLGVERGSQMSGKTHILISPNHSLPGRLEARRLTPKSQFPNLPKERAD